MAYGLTFYGANNQLIFDTNSYSGNSTLVIQYGHPLSNWSNGSTITIPSDAFLFVRVNSGNLRMTHGGTSGTAYDQVRNDSGQTISYFFARQSASIGNISGGGTYGLEIYASDGSTVTFSTRRTDSVVRFIEIWDHGTRNNTDYVYTGNPSGIYVSVGYAYYNQGLSVNQFYFHNTGTQGIEYKGQLSTIYGSGYVPNKGSILIANIED